MPPPMAAMSPSSEQGQQQAGGAPGTLGGFNSAHAKSRLEISKQRLKDAPAFLGNRLLNLGPNVSPAALAAALIERRDSALATGARPDSERPMQPVAAFRSGSEEATTTGSNGRPATGYISVSELDTMLQGLRSSLASIQESRAQYMRLLAERDATIVDLQSQLQQQARQIEDLEFRATESESRVSIAESHMLQAEDRAADAEARVAEAQLVLQHQVEELQEARDYADKMARAARDAQVYSSQTQQQAVPRHSPTPPPPTAMPRPVANEVVLYYRSSWKQCYIHFNADNKGWTTVPGVLMEPASEGYRVVRLPGSRAEFALNNGKGEWDSNNNNNYHVSSAGTYRLEHGQLHKTMWICGTEDTQVVVVGSAMSVGPRPNHVSTRRQQIRSLWASAVV